MNGAMNNTIGHFNKSASGCKKSTRLTEITTDNFKTLLEYVCSIPECSCTKESDKTRYNEWKRTKLPILFFTLINSRPETDTAAASSCFALIDIDGDCTHYVSEHPCIYYTNYTKNGTHFIIHSDALGSAETPMEWQDVYNSIAYEVWYELCCKYKRDIKLDGNSSRHSQGCFLWNTEWVENNSVDFRWMPSERYLTDTVIGEMYAENTYSRQTINTSRKGTKKVEKPNNAETISDLARISNYRISSQALKNFNICSYNEFIARYSEKYTITTGTIPVFSEYTDYLGNTYDMFKTNGQMVTLWQPYMRHIEGNDCKIREGGRLKSLLSHLKELCMFMHDNLDPDYVLFDAVHWIERYCDNPMSFSKSELMSAVTTALNTHSLFNEKTLHTDKRMFITGDCKIDTTTGEVSYMSKNEKIAANSRCRKTERILEVIRLYDPSKNVEDNIKFIQDQYIEGVSDKSYRTILNYIQTAKSVPDLVNEYKWLENIQIKAGKPVKPIVILDISANRSLYFKSVKECKQFMNTNSKTFSKFLKGCSNLNKTYKILKF